MAIARIDSHFKSS